MCQEDTDQSPKKKSHELEIKMEADNPTSWGVIVAILIFVKGNNSLIIAVARPANSQAIIRLNGARRGKLDQ